MNKRHINISFSLVEAATWGMYAVVLGFATNFLGGVCGLQSYQISLVMGASAAAACGLQVAVGELVSRIPQLKLHAVLLGACVAMLLGLGLMYLQPAAWLTVAGMALVSIVLQTVPGMGTTLCIDAMGRGMPANYSMARGFGSISYALSAAVTGRLLASLGPQMIPLLSAVLALVLIAATLWFYHCGVKHFPELPAAKKQESRQKGFLKAHPGFILLLAGATMLCVSHFLVGSFVQLIIEAKGGGEHEQGIATAVTALCSFPVSFCFPLLQRRFRGRRMLQFAAVMIMAKPVGLLLSTAPEGVYVAMATQMLGYALYEISAITYVDKLMGPEEAVRVQSYLSATMSAGSVAAMSTGGVLCQFCGVQTMIAIAAVFALAGACTVILWVQKNKT